MTTGRPGAPGLHTTRWLRERLAGMGLAEDQIVTTALRGVARYSEADLEPSSYTPEFALLVQRLGRLMGGGRGLSVYVTGGRNEPQARTYAALQIALGMAPSGRHIVLIDADFLRPGLFGLIADPLAEGVTDMVRFGRSTRALVQRPVPEGPGLLPAGSFPADDPSPLGTDALRSVVYRVSQVCDLALYVGPLPIRSELHPLARVCDHVVYAGGEETSESTTVMADAVAALHAHGAHVAGVVVCTPAMQHNGEATRADALPAAKPLQAPHTPSPFDAPIPAQEPTAWRPQAPPPQSEWEPVPQSTFESEWQPKPDREPWQPAPQHGLEPEWQRTAPAARTSEWQAAPELSPDAEWKSQREATESPGIALPHIGLPELGEPPRRSEARAPFDFEQAPPRPRDEWRDAARGGSPPVGDFDVEEERTGSRWPTFVVVAIVVAIVAFLGVLGFDRFRDSRQLGSNPVPSTEATRGEPTAPGATSSTPTSPGSQGAPNTAPTPAKVTPPLNQAPVPNSLDDESASHAAKPPVTPDKITAPVKAPLEAQAPVITPKQTAPSTPPVVSPPVASSPVVPPAVTHHDETPTGAAADVVYYVHVASYQTQPKADVEIETLRKHGFTARAVAADLGEKGVWLRIMVGPFETRTEADAARAALLALPEYDFAQVRRVSRD